MSPSVIIKHIATSSLFRHIWFTDGYIEFGLVACLASVYVSCGLRSAVPSYMVTGVLSFITGIVISIRVLHVSAINNPLQVWSALACMALFATSFITVLTRRRNNNALHLHLCATLLSMWFLAAANYHISIAPTNHSGELYNHRLSRFTLSNTAVALLHIISLACMQDGPGEANNEEGSIRLQTDGALAQPLSNDVKSMV